MADTFDAPSMQTSAPADAPAGGSPLACFPLNRSRKWEYEVTVVAGEEKPKTVAATRSFKDTRTVGDHEYLRMVTEVTGGAMRVPDQLYRGTPEGICAAVQGTEGKELLILPADPRANSRWSGEAKPSIENLQAQARVGEVYRQGELECRDCVCVTMSMTVVEQSFFGGRTETPVRFERWFAPQVGMVREVRIVGEEGKPNYLKSESRLTKFSDQP